MPAANISSARCESNGIWKVLRSTDMVTLTDSTVLILGETDRRRHHGRQYVV